MNLGGSPKKSMIFRVNQLPPKTLIFCPHRIPKTIDIPYSSTLFLTFDDHRGSLMQGCGPDPDVLALSGFNRTGDESRGVILMPAVQNYGKYCEYYYVGSGSGLFFEGRIRVFFLLVGLVFSPRGCGPIPGQLHPDSQP